MENMKNIKITEAQVQKQIVDYLTVARIFFFAVVNELGGANASIRMRRYVALGLRAGVSDLVALLEQRIIFFEVKTLDGRMSNYQKMFRDKVLSLGFEYYVVCSVEDVISAIEHGFVDNKFNKVKKGDRE